MPVTTKFSRTCGGKQRAKVQIPEDGSTDGNILLGKRSSGSRGTKTPPMKKPSSQAVNSKNASNLRKMRRLSQVQQNPVLNEDISSADFSYHQNRTSNPRQNSTQPEHVLQLSNGVSKEKIIVTGGCWSKAVNSFVEHEAS